MRRATAAILIAIAAVTATGCAHITPIRVKPVSVQTCYAPNPDAGACHGNVYVPS